MKGELLVLKGELLVLKDVYQSALMLANADLPAVISNCDAYLWRLQAMKRFALVSLACLSCFWFVPFFGSSVALQD